MTNYQKLLEEQSIHLKKAVKHLKFSYEKVKKLSTEIEKLNESQLADWESFVARFSRTSDLFLSKYLRTYILKEDPGFNGTFKDLLNQAEKIGIIDETDPWVDIREQRNKAAHEYNDQDLSPIFHKVRILVPLLIQLEKKL